MNQKMYRDEWMSKALCIDMETDIFYNSDRDSNKVVKARETCMKCPVILQCRVHAVESGEKFGIWGGMDGDERKAWWRRVRNDKSKTL